MKAWELYIPTDGNRPERQVALYALWRLQRHRQRPLEFERAEIRAFNDLPGSVQFIGSGDDTIHKLPGPTMAEWRERIGRLNGQKHKDKPFPRPHRFKGITVLEHWPWTDARRWEEQDSVRQLLRPMPASTVYVSTC